MIMSGVSIVQWRGSIGLFNVQKNPQRTSVDNHKPFLISSNLKKYLNFFHVRLSLVLSLIYSIILLFGLSCMAITLFVLITFIRLGFGYFICPDSVFFLQKYFLYSLPGFLISKIYLFPGDKSHEKYCFPVTGIRHAPNNGWN